MSAFSGVKLHHHDLPAAAFLHSLSFLFFGKLLRPLVPTAVFSIHVVFGDENDSHGPPVLRVRVS